MDKDEYIWKQRNEILHKKVNRQMAEIKDLHKKSETIFDLARRFPNKTYRELEKYKDADRQEEANSIPLTDSQKDLVKDAEKAIKKDKNEKCITGEMRKDREEINWRKKYDIEHKLRQEAEGEMTIVKGIGQSSPEMKGAKSEVEALKQQLFVDKKDAEEALANALAINESHQKLNGKLQDRLTEVEEENKKLHAHVDKQVSGARKSGL